MVQHEEKIFIFVIGLVISSIMAENSSVPSTTNQQKHTVAPRWANFKASFAPPTSMRQRLSSAAPPIAILIEEPHASVATPPSIMISEPLIPAAPSPLILIEEPHSHVASPPVVNISELFVSATPSSTLRAIESHLRIPQPINDKVMVEAKVDLAHLQKLCPLADICTTNKSDKQRMEIKNSCCLPCKCDAMCSEIGNCCEKSNSHGYMCHSPYVEDGINRDLGYFMVDRCLNKSTFTDCLGENVAPWGTLYPVYDPVTDRNFYNHRCAECSGVYNYIFWDLNLEPLTFDLSLSTCLSALSGGRQHGCRIGFAPPKDMNKMDQACRSDLISSCNFTGLWSQYDTDLERACAMMYSPVRDHSGYPAYANVYCALCNGVNYVPDDVCNSINDGFDIPSRLPGSHNPLSMLLDYEKVESVINSASIPGTTVSNNGICGKLMVKHPKKKECRAILCPNGYYRNKEECVVVSNNWQTSLYYIQLIMTPDGDLPPLDILLSNEALQPPELWFDSHITPLDYFKLYAKTIPIIIGEDVYFEECVVRVGRRQFPLDIAAETKMIREAMNKTWTMNLKGRAFSFTARFDRYAEFIPHGTSRRYDVVRSLTNEFFFENESPPRSRYYLLESSDDATPDVTLKKTHFCERVRLSRSEWEGGYQEIRLYLDSEGPTVDLGDSEFDIFTDDDGRPTVEICLDDFNPNYEIQLGVESEVWSGVVSTNSANSYLFVIVLMLSVQAIRGPTF